MYSTTQTQSPSSQDIPQDESKPKLYTMGHKIQETSCCSFIQKSIQGIPILDWYFSPITYDIGFSLSCLLYHWINWWLSVGILIYLSVSFGVFIPFIILACIGVPLLWLTAETVILLSRFIFSITYYLVETDPKLLTNEKWRIKLTMDNKNLPLCETCCASGSRFERIKFIITSTDFYLMILYHLFINPIIGLLLGLSSLPVLYLLYGISNLIRYPFNIKWYENNRECLGTQNCNNGRPCNCNGWALNSFGDVFGYFLICFILLPFALHLNNLFAKYGKNICYYILTDYFKYKNIKNNPNQSLISKNSAGKTNVTTTDNTIIKYNNTEEEEEETDNNNKEIPRTNKVINDHGINEHNDYDDL